MDLAAVRVLFGLSLGKWDPTAERMRRELESIPVLHPSEIT